MAETKNTFIKSKMNKDLDERLIPQGEYKDAQNVTISRSEGDDVGTFQNILGNTADIDYANELNLEEFKLRNIQEIGYLADETTNNVFIFLTDWNDSSNDTLSNFASSGSNHYICCYNVLSNSFNILVQGHFLNFSKTHKVLAVNRVEDLLFFTDNRNQPRKINWKTALSNPNYYQNEDHISVAKYYPFVAPDFLREREVEATLNPSAGDQFILEINTNSLEVGMQVTITDGVPSWNNKGLWITNIIDETTIQVNQTFTLPNPNPFNLLLTEYGLKDCVSEYLPSHYSDANNSTSGSTIDFKPLANYSPNSTEFNSAIQPGMRVTGFLDNKQRWKPDVEYNISSVNAGTGTEKPAVIVPTPPNSDSNQKLSVSGENPYYNENFPGDKEFLKDKFVRFSYRFKFDDNEYSLIAPFSQHAFIPQNFGYILVDDEIDIARTTILETMRNSVNCVKLRIPKPTRMDGNLAIWSQVQDLFKVTDIEILATFSNETSIRVIDEISIQAAANLPQDDKGFIYEYQSRKPIRTLPESEIVRAYDKVPVRALSQEIVGNRVIYGNFEDKHSFPLHLNYNIRTGSKRDLPFTQTQRELPNHTLKQNRTYQVGVILSDRYGRQTDVILSNVDAGLSLGSPPTVYGGSTVFHEYIDNARTGNDANGFIPTWPGDELQAIFSSPIPSSLDLINYPGLYQAAVGTSTNPLGFMTYKLAVKQQEQDYYNVYFWNMAHANTSVSPTFFASTSYQTLLKDNINKVPKDLENVGPQDKEYSSSVELYNRVDTKFVSGSGDYSGIYNKINYTPTLSSKITGVYEGLQFNPSGGSWLANTLDFNSEALRHGRTAFTIGIDNNDQEIGYFSSAGSFQKQQPLPAIYETNPVVSNLEIFYETSTTGLISTLNEDINSGSLAADSIGIVSWELTEATEPGQVVGTIELKDSFGATILDPLNTASIASVSFNNGPNLNPDTTPPFTNNAFLIQQQLVGTPPVPTGRFEIVTNTNYYYGTTGGNYLFTIDCVTSGESASLNFARSLTNIAPAVGEDGPNGSGNGLLNGFYSDLTGSGLFYFIYLPGASCSLCSLPLISGVNGTFFQGTTNTIYASGGIDNGPFPTPAPPAHLYEIPLGKGVWARNGSKDPNNWYNDLTYNYTAHDVNQQNINDVNAIFDLSTTDGTLNFDEAIARQLSQLRSGQFTGQYTYYIDCLVTDGGGLTAEQFAMAYVISF